MRMRRVVGLFLVAAGTAHGVLIPFTDRAQFAAATTLAAGLPSANGVDFTTTPVCPDSTGCPTGSPGFFNYSSNVSNASVPVTLNFSSITGFTIGGYFGSSTGSTSRLALYAVGYDHPNWLPMTYSSPILSTRNSADNANIGALRIRLNLPANVNSFALDLSNGCNTNSNAVGPNDCGPEDNHLGTILVTAKRVGQAIVASDTALVTTADTLATGELTFFGARSDAENIEYIDLTLPAFISTDPNVPNTGSIMTTNIAFGNAVPTPEPSTLVLTAVGLALLLRRKLY